MTKGVMTLMKGMAAGMAAGVAAGAAGAIMVRDSRKNRKRFAMAVNVLDSIGTGNEVDVGTIDIYLGIQPFVDQVVDIEPPVVIAYP